MPDIGPLELVIVLVIVLLVFGPKRLPGLGRQLGTGMREFKDSITGKDGDRDRDRDPDEDGGEGRGELPAAPASATAATRREEQPAARREE